jgi:hypothetical protein
MARLQLGYARGLIRVAPAADLARVVFKKLQARLRSPPAAPPLDDDAIAAAADALGRAPRLFTAAPLGAVYRQRFPAAIERYRARAERILGHEIDIFGVPRSLGSRLDWRVDPLGGRRIDGAGLFPDGVDPKGAWELGRAGHLVELAAAARLIPALQEPARAELVAELDSFWADNPVGLGLHYASPLEVALRAIHWLSAVELLGGAPALPRPFIERLAARLLGDGHFLATHLEDHGVVPANHLLGDYVGLWAIGLALDGAPGARRWQAQAARGLAVQAARQVGADGAHFEASTSYHRFALELVLVAHLYARSAGHDDVGAAAASQLGETLHRMLSFVAGYVGPDGCEPAFGDSDDARLCPLVPRPPREHAYLLSVGAALFGDPSLKLPSVALSEEALWLGGPSAAQTWDWLPATAPPRAASFPSGGVHVLRSDHWQVELRSGSYGQRGVGGHAHNDQLSVVAWLDEKPLLVDPGTARYAADMVARDRFRGTAAHSTIVVDGAEQSPIHDGRPFALLDHAGAAPVRLEDSGDVAELVGVHDGYRRLRCRVRHQRHLRLRRSLECLLIEDRLDGRGAAGVELRFHLGLPARLLPPDEAARHLAALTPVFGRLDPTNVVALGEPISAILVGTTPGVGRPILETGAFSAKYGSVAPIPLVTFRALLTFPAVLTTIFIRLGELQG